MIKVHDRVKEFEVASIKITKSQNEQKYGSRHSTEVTVHFGLDFVLSSLYFFVI